MSRLFDVGGFVGFVLPIILDGIFNKLAPWLFAPNNIRMLQRVDMSFAQVAARKRRDRALQVLPAAAASTTPSQRVPFALFEFE